MDPSQLVDFRWIEVKTWRMYESYMALSPRPQDFPKLLDRMGALLTRPLTIYCSVTGSAGTVCSSRPLRVAESVS